MKFPRGNFAASSNAQGDDDFRGDDNHIFTDRTYSGEGYDRSTWNTM